MSHERLQTLRTWVLPWVAGLLFALGLGLSGMTEPAKVLGFLDVAGAWDPSLAFVMGGAVGSYFLQLRLARRRMDGTPRTRPRATQAAAPLADRRLVGGAALFGMGWGLAGLCPGPALVVAAGALTQALPEALVFVAAMTGAMLAVRFAPAWRQRLRGAPPEPLRAAAPQGCGPLAGPVA